MYNVYFNNIKLASKLVYKNDRIFVSWQSKKKEGFVDSKGPLEQSKRIK